MNTREFDFGALVDEQFKDVRRSYRFGKSFNEDKSLTPPEKPTVAAASDDNVTLLQAWNEGAPIYGIVEKEIKGGYEVTTAGTRAFCPFSQIDTIKKDAAEYIGRKFEFLVTEYAKDERGLNVIVSRRALLDRLAAKQREETLARLTEGETVNGTITRVMEFGAFVDLGGIEGLIPAREVAWERVEDLNTLLKAGDGVTVKILHIDRDQQKISLSRKECMMRTFRRSPEDEAAAKSEAEVAEWLQKNAVRNARVGTMAAAFSNIGI